MSEINKKRLKLIIRWIGTILSILLFIYLFYQTGFEEIFTTFKELSYFRILMVIFLIFISRMATFARWHVLLQVEQIKVNWRDSLRLTFAGLFASNFLPTTIGGDVVRLAGAMRIGISGSLAAASLIMDRLIGMAGMTLALPFSLSPLINLLDAQTTQGGYGFLGMTAIINLILDKAKLFVKKLTLTFSHWIRHPIILLSALIFTLIHMASIFLIVQILINGMGEEMSYWKIAGLWSLTYFITLIPISINGLGLQELSITNIFILLGGLSSATSLSLALFIRALLLLGSLPGAFLISGIISGESYSQAENALDTLQEQI